MRCRPAATERPAAGVARSRGWLGLLALLLAGGLVGALAGCATIPDSGPVVHGRALDSDPGQEFQVIPNPPAPGADAVNIVAGFLKAAAGFSDDHQVARSFLTPQRRLAWQPDASVVVYPSLTSPKIKDLGPPPVPAPTATPSPTRSIAPGQSAGDVPQASSTPSTPAVTNPSDVTRVSVQTPVTARIDGDGHYTQSRPGDTEKVMFTLVRTGGQWRISQLADGILISSANFDLAFKPYPVYYTDPAGRYLVPDLHWLAGSREEQGAASLPTTLVRVMLDGPPAWLQGAVVSGAPPGTKMDVAAVVVSNQVATVDLNETVRSASTRARQLLLSQLQATLGQLSNILSVQITVNRVSFDVPLGSGSGGSDAGQQAAHPVLDPTVGDEPVVVDSKGRLDRLDGLELTAVRDVDGLEVQGVNHPAVSIDGSSAYAVLDGRRRTLLLQAPGAKAVAAVHGTNLTAPSFDPQGWVWTSPGTSGGYVYAAGVDGGRVKVSAPWMKGFGVVALRLSRDGTRAALAVDYRGHPHLFVAGVVRDARGVPVSLNPPMPQLYDLTAIQDVAWIDDGDLAVLARRIGTADVPWILQIGGAVRAAPAVAGAESIAGGNGETSILAGTSKGTYARVGARWAKMSSARWPAYPG